MEIHGAPKHVAIFYAFEEDAPGLLGKFLYEDEGIRWFAKPLFGYNVDEEIYDILCAEPHCHLHAVCEVPTD